MDLISCFIKKCDYFNSFSFFSFLLFQPNHLIGLKQKYLKLSFANIADLTKVKRDIMRAVKINKVREKSNTYYTDMLATTLQSTKQDSNKQTLDRMDNILDIR